MIRERKMCEPCPPMTPLEYLATNSLAFFLRAYGATNRALGKLRFTQFDPDIPFRRWKVVTPAGLPPDLCKAYCALKWLILDEPVYSENKQLAWRYIAGVHVHELHIMEMQTRHRQSKRARKPRRIVGDYGETITQLVERLALDPEYGTLSAKGLWPHFRATLESHRLGPKEVVSPRDPGEFVYMYNYGEGTQTISFGHFANVVSRARRKKSH